MCVAVGEVNTLLCVEIPFVRRRKEEDNVFPSTFPCHISKADQRLTFQFSVT